MIDNETESEKNMKKLQKSPCSKTLKPPLFYISSSSFARDTGPAAEGESFKQQVLTVVSGYVGSTELERVT